VEAEVKARSILVLSVLTALSAASFGGCSINFDSKEASGSSFTPSSPPGPPYVEDEALDLPTSGGVSGLLGAECATERDCGGVLNCLKATSEDPIFGGGPAGGFCTKACDTNDDCPGTHSACLKNGTVESGRCTLTCSIGPPLIDLDQALAADKCRGRADLRCDKVKNVGTVCLPTCGSDAQCGPERVCDPRLAMCVAKPSTGLPTGATCDLSADPTTCAGSCIPFLDADVTSCSTPCVLGGASPDAQSCGGPMQGICAFHPPENGPGDFGYCSPRCEAHSQCQINPDFWCFNVPAYGQAYCFSATPCKVQSDCEKVKIGYACTSTAKGSFCLDPAIPVSK
jgi:hypothetical protein